MIASSTQRFNLELELEQPSAIGEVLCVDSCVQLVSVEAGVDLVRLNGEIITNLIYLDNDEPAKLKNQFFTQAFSHELMASNLTPQDSVCAEVSVFSTETKLDGELSSSKGTILLTLGLQANIYVEKENNIELVVDAFCPRYNLVTSTTQSLFVGNKSIDAIFEKIDGSVVLNENSERIDRVLCVSGQNILIESVADSVVVGKMFCNIIFTLDDENCSVNSILATIPFSIRFEPKYGAISSVDVVIRNIDARHKRAKEIDIISELYVKISYREERTISYLSDCTLGEKRNEYLPPLCLYYVSQADSLWGLSKMLCVSKDVIMEQNPELTFPLRSCPVLVYRKRESS